MLPVNQPFAILRWKNIEKTGLYISGPFIVFSCKASSLTPDSHLKYR